MPLSNNTAHQCSNQAENAVSQTKMINTVIIQFNSIANQVDSKQFVLRYASLLIAITYCRLLVRQAATNKPFDSSTFACGSCEKDAVYKKFVRLCLCIAFEEPKTQVKF